MFRLETYMNDLIRMLQQRLGDKLLYVGLQGSYLRNEATEDSDIDVMVLVDDLSIKDLDVYRETIVELVDYEKSCGFICGKAEFAKWNPLELSHLLHSTKDYYGKLSEYIPQYSERDIINFIKLSLGNLYHEICHRYIHADREKNIKKLPSAYKSVFFILQNIYFIKTGIFSITKKELMTQLDASDRKVMSISMQISGDCDYNFDEAFDSLFMWCQRTLSNL